MFSCSHSRRTDSLCVVLEIATELQCHSRYYWSLSEVSRNYLNLLTMLFNNSMSP